MSPWRNSTRLFATVNQVPLKTVIPKNRHKKSINLSAPDSSIVGIPTPNQSIHPFYSPNINERATLCLSEKNPEILSGKPIVPVIIEHPGTSKPTLINARWQFHTVQDINKWVQSLRRATEPKGKLEIINDYDVNHLLRSSRLDRSQLPKIKKLASLFAEASQGINPNLISTFVESMIAEKETVVFSEDVFLYLLQHYSKSSGSMIGIIESVIEFLHKDIDQFKVAELLAVQILVTIRNNAIDSTPALTTAIERLVDAISQRFNHTNCVIQFEPAVIQLFLEFYLKSGNLMESKVLFRDLINKKLCPRSTLAADYLRLIDEKFGFTTNDEQILKKFVYISDFAPVFRTTLSPQIVECLIPYCRHFNEINSLLSLIEKSSMTRQIYDSTLPQFIRKASLLTSNKLNNAGNLASIYQRAVDYYGTSLSDKIRKSFILQFAVNHNFSMVAKLVTGLNENASPNFFANIMTMVDQWPYNESALNLPGFDISYKRKFLKELVLPNFAKLSMPGKLAILEHLDTTDLMASAARVEMELFKSNKESLLAELLVQSFKNDFDSIVSSLVKSLSATDRGRCSLARACELHNSISSIIQFELKDSTS